MVTASLIQPSPEKSGGGLYPCAGCLASSTRPPFGYGLAAEPGSRPDLRRSWRYRPTDPQAAAAMRAARKRFAKMRVAGRHGERCSARRAVRLGWANGRRNSWGYRRATTSVPMPPWCNSVCESCLCSVLFTVLAINSSVAPSVPITSAAVVARLWLAIKAVPISFNNLGLSKSF